MKTQILAWFTRFFLIIEIFAFSNESANDPSQHLVIAMLPNQEESVESMNLMPLETIVLELPEIEKSEWKKTTYVVDKSRAFVEYIPIKDTGEKFSELICLHYFSESIGKEATKGSLEGYIDYIQLNARMAYPGRKAFWQIIEQNKNDAIYESILFEPYEELEPFHQISRSIFTDKGFYSVVYIKKKTQLTAEEREKWIKLLKENTSVVSFTEGEKSKGFTFTQDVHRSVFLGDQFENWRKQNTYFGENGRTLICHIPPTQSGRYITECVEVITSPTLDESPAKEFFEIEKENVKRNEGKKIKFKVLEKSKSEIIYTYLYELDHLDVTAIVRTCVKYQGYYSITYKRGFDEELKKDEILKWVEKLKSIQIIDPKNERVSTVGLEKEKKI